MLWRMPTATRGLLAGGLFSIVLLFAGAFLPAGTVSGDDPYPGPLFLPIITKLDTPTVTPTETPVPTPTLEPTWTPSPTFTPTQIPTATPTPYVPQYRCGDVFSDRIYLDGWSTKAYTWYVQAWREIHYSFTVYPDGSDLTIRIYDSGNTPLIDRKYTSYAYGSYTVHYSDTFRIEYWNPSFFTNKTVELSLWQCGVW